MRVSIIKGKGVQPNSMKSIQPIVGQLKAIEDELTNVLVFTISKYDMYSDKVKAGKSLLSLDYIYNDKALLNDPDLIDEFKEVAEAIKIINKYATKRADAQSKAHFKKIKEQRNKQKEQE